MYNSRDFMTYCTWFLRVFEPHRSIMLVKVAKGEILDNKDIPASRPTGGPAGRPARLTLWRLELSQQDTPSVSSGL
jgi:hypothetical protein